MKKNKARERNRADEVLVSFLKMILDGEFIKRRDINLLIKRHLAPDYTDREMRKAKQVLSYDMAILAGSKGEGYRRARHSSILSDAELAEEIKAWKTQINTRQHRIESEKMSMRPEIAVLKMLIKEQERREKEKTL